MKVIFSEISAIARYGEENGSLEFKMQNSFSQFPAICGKGEQILVVTKLDSKEISDANYIVPLIYNMVEELNIKTTSTEPENFKMQNLCSQFPAICGKGEQDLVVTELGSKEISEADFIVPQIYDKVEELNIETTLTDRKEIKMQNIDSKLPAIAANGEKVQSEHRIVKKINKKLVKKGGRFGRENNPQPLVVEDDDDYKNVRLGVVPSIVNIIEKSVQKKLGGTRTNERLKTNNYQVKSELDYLYDEDEERKEILRLDEEVEKDRDEMRNLDEQILDLRNQDLQPKLTIYSVSAEEEKVNSELEKLIINQRREEIEEQKRKLEIKKRLTPRKKGKDTLGYYEEGMQFGDAKRDLLNTNDVSIATLYELRYPPTWIQPLYTAYMRATSFAIQPKKASGPTLNPKKFSDVGEMCAIWKLKNDRRFSVYANTPKPTVYRFMAFRRWVQGRIYALTQLMTSKVQYVTGNEAARYLYYGAHSGRVGDLGERLLKASIFIDSYAKIEPTVERSTSIVEFVSRPEFNKYFTGQHSLIIGGQQCKNLEELERLRNIGLFRRQNGIYKRCFAYLSGDPHVRLVDLVVLLNERIKDVTLTPEQYDFVYSSVEPVYQGKLIDDSQEIIVPVYQGGSFEEVIKTNEVVEVCDIQEEMQGAQPSTSRSGHPIGLASGRIEVEHTIPGLDELQTVVSGLAPGAPDVVRHIVQLSSFIYLITRLEKFDLIAAASLQFVAGNDFIYRSLQGSIGKICQNFGLIFQGKNGKPELKRTVELESEVDSADPWSNPVVVDVASTAAATFMLGTMKDIGNSFYHLVPNLVSEIRKSVLIESGKSIASVIIDTIKILFQRIKLAIDTKDFSILYKGKDPSRWVTDAQGFINSFPIITTQGDNSTVLPQIAKLKKEKMIHDNIHHSLTLPDYFEMVKIHLLEGRDLLQLYKNNLSLAAQIKKVWDNLNQFYLATYNATLAGGIRIKPFALYFYGKAGVGKTNIVNDLLKSIADLMGYDPTKTYTYVSGLNFQECDQSHWGFIYDDPDTSVAPASASKLTHIEELIRLLNNNKYSVEQAAVDRKGLVYAAPSIVCYSSNFSNGRAPQYTAFPDAFYRRFEYTIEMSVKKEFTKPDGIRLDLEKVEGCTHYNWFNFNVSVYSGEAQNHLSHIKTFTKVNELFIFIRAKFMLHLEAQKRLITRLQSVNNCKECGLSKARNCGCMDTSILELDEEEEVKDVMLPKLETSQEEVKMVPIPKLEYFEGEIEDDEEEDILPKFEGNFDEFEDFEYQGNLCPRRRRRRTVDEVIASLEEFASSRATLPVPPYDFETTRRERQLTREEAGQFYKWYRNATSTRFEIENFVPQLRRVDAPLGIIVDYVIDAELVEVEDAVILDDTLINEGEDYYELAVNAEEEFEAFMAERLRAIGIVSDEEFERACDEIYQRYVEEHGEDFVRYVYQGQVPSVVLDERGVPIEQFADDSYFSRPILPSTNTLRVIVDENVDSFTDAWEQIRAHACFYARVIVDPRSLVEPTHSYWQSALRGTLFWIPIICAVFGSALLMRTLHRFIYQGREENSTGILPKSWVRVEQTYTPGIPTRFTGTTWTYDDVVTRIRSCLLRVSCAKTKYTMWGFVVASRVMIVPTHLCPEIGDEILIESNNKQIKFIRTPGNSTPMVHAEMLILNVAELANSATSLTFIQQVIDEAVTVFDQVHIVLPQSVYTTSRNSQRSVGGRKTYYTDALTKAGDCGAVYVGCVGNSWRIIGLHYAGATVNGAQNGSLGSPITANEIQIKTRNLGVIPQGQVVISSTFTHNPQELVLGRFSKQSEVWAAQNTTKSIASFGQMYPPLPASSMKSKVTRSNFACHPLVMEREKSYCGVTPYWQVPNFRGEMVGDNWISPWTQAFETLNVGKFDEDIMWIALADYLNGIDKLDCNGYSPLSEDSVIRGVPGSYINSINMSTSTGPPYNTVKRNMMYHDQKIGAFVDKRILSTFDEIEETIKNGDIPLCIGVCALKDEAIKPGKAPRVFICLPFALNMSLKKHGSPWKCFVRANFDFFESAVGINMTSSECNKVIEKLKVVDPLLESIYDGDIKRIDKSWSAELYQFVAKLIYSISFAINCDPYENHSLCLALLHLKYSIKNDIFSVPWNPSGNDWTVELNSLCVCLCERYVYYKQNPFNGDFAHINEFKVNFYDNPIPKDIQGLDFRNNVALVCYGDDNLKSMRYPLKDDYCHIWLNDLGFEMTSANKMTKIKACKIDEISFLKRRFVWDEELGYYIPPLEEKSLIRMLCIKKFSFLTAGDHGASVITDYLKERVYFGREVYEKEKEFCEVLISEHPQVKGSRYLQIQDYDYWRAQMIEDTFQTWNDGTLQPIQNIEGEYFSIEMQGLELVKDAKIPSNNITVTEAISSEMGEITTTTEMRVPTTIQTNKFFQDLPSTSLDAFMCRPVVINQVTLATTDVFGIAAVFDPVSIFLNLVTVKNKLANYQYFRGTMQVTAVLTAPGGCYGEYVFCAVPDGGLVVTAPGIAAVLHPDNCMQVDQSVRLDVSKSTQGVLELPWIYPYDYEVITTLQATSSGTWTCYVVPLSAIKTGIPGGYTSAQITFYGCFLPGYELLCPVYQGELSGYAAQIGNAANSITNIPIIGSVAGMVGEAANAASAVLSWFGFSRENHESAPISIVNKSVTNVAHTDGQDSNEKASLCENNAISIDPSLVGCSEEDPLAFPSLFKRWTIIKQLTWSTANSGILVNIPVSPFYGKVYSTYTMTLTTAGYIGLPFNHWRGSMEYKLIIPVSQFHRGKLQVFWVPENGVITGDPTNVAFNHIFDVTSGEDHTFRIGYAREKPYLVCDLINDSFAIQPVGSTNGGFYLKIINPIVAQNSTTVDIIILARAGEDMDFFLPRENLTYINVAGTGVQNYNLRDCANVQGAIYQGALGDGSSEDNMIDLVPTSKVPFPAVELYSGESIRSVRALLQKPSQMATGSVVDTDYWFPYLGPNATPSAGAGNPWTYVGWYSVPFLGFAASERYKLFPSSPMWIGAAREYYITQPTHNSISTLAPMTYVGPNLGAEFVIPYYTPYKFYPCRKTSSTVATVNNYTTKLSFRQSGTPVASPTVFYYSLGDDIRATCFRQLPQLVVSTASPSTNWFI